MKGLRLLPTLLAFGFIIDLIFHPEGSLDGEILYNAAVFAAGFTVLRAGRQPRVDRIGALGLSLGIFAWAVGSTSASLSFHEFGGVFSSLTTQTVFYLGFYPLTVIGINRLLSRRSAFTPDEFLNAIIIGLGIATITATLVIELMNFGKLVGTQTFVNTIYPVADTVLLSYALASVLILPKRNSPRALFMAAGIGAFTLFDFYYLKSVGEGTYIPYRWPDLGWLLGFVLIAESPWRYGEERQSQGRGGVVETVAAGAALLVLSLSVFGVHSFPWYTEVPAVATIVVAFIRLGISLQTSRRLLTEQVLARTDELTGLANRRRFVAATAAAIEQWNESGRHGSLLLLDLDGFKEVNDTLGHQTGDELLKNVAARMSGALPRNSLFARLGGDEFGLLLYNTSDAAGVLTVAAMIREALTQPVDIEGVRIRVDASVGIALAPEHGLTTTDLLRHADVAMYRAKRGRSGAAIFDAELDALDGDRLGLAEELLDAVRHDQLLIHYQPKVDLIDGNVTELEALLRWQHPRLGLLSAPDFMSIAEKTGIIIDLTRVVLRKVTDQLVEWRQAGLDISIAVNINARELESVEIVDVVHEMLNTHRLSPESLVLEITEEVLVKDPATARKIITALDRLGVRVSIDDFGTGYSSLSYLQHLPVHEIKLDQTFVAQLSATDAEAATRARAVAKSVIDLARSLGMISAAEGVEKAEQLVTLRAIGCDTAQGFYFAPPMSPVATTLWLATKLPLALDAD